MNEQRPCNNSINTRTTAVNHALFSLEGYGSVVNHAQNIVAIPWNLQKVPEIVQLTDQIRSFGWHIQIGVF